MAGSSTSSSSSTTSSSSTPPSFPRSLRPNLWDALDALRRVRLLDAEVHADLVEAYGFLRTVESRLRIVHNRSGVDLPDDAGELVRLARRLSYEEADPAATIASFRADCARHTERTRASSSS